MPLRHASRGRVLLLVVLVTLCSSMARAQTVDDGVYDRWIAAALQAFDGGDYDASRAAFEQAHGISPSARTLRGLGAADFKAGRFAAAFVELDAALRDERRPLPQDLRAAVQSLLEQARARVTLLEVIGAPPSAVVFIDDRAPMVDRQGRIVVERGHHSVRVEAPGREPARVAIQPMFDAERIHVELRHAPAPIAPAVTPRRESTLSPDRKVFAAVKPAPRELTWTWLAAAGVPLFAASAGLAWARTQDIGDGIAARCKRELCDENTKDDWIAKSPLRTFETLTNVAWALAGTSLVATVVLFVNEGQSSEIRTDVALRPGALTLTSGF